MSFVKGLCLSPRMPGVLALPGLGDCVWDLYWCVRRAENSRCHTGNRQLDLVDTFSTCGRLEPWSCTGDFRQIVWL